MRNSKWLRLLAYVTGSVNQELLLRNEYLAAENQTLRAKLSARLRLSDPERTTLAEIGKRPAQISRLYEYACHEGNYGMLGILSGHRAQENASKDQLRSGSLSAHHFPLASVSIQLLPARVSVQIAADMRPRRRATSSPRRFGRKVHARHINR